MFREYETKNGIYILKKSLFFLMRYRLGLLLSIITVACDGILIFLLLYIEYTVYYISLFDTQLFYKLLELDIWGHFLRIIIYLLFLFCAFLIKTTLTLLFTRNLILFFRNKNNSFIDFSYIINILYAIGLLSCIYTLNTFNRFLEVIFVQDFVIKFLNILQGKPIENYAYMNTPEGFLFFPIFVNQKHPSIAKALDASEKLLTDAFGQESHQNFSFLWIDISIFTVFFIMLGLLINHYYSFFTACIITTIFYFMIRTLINYLLIIFKTTVYEYAQNKKCPLFTQQEIHAYFKPKSF